MDEQTPHLTQDLCVDLLHGLLGPAERAAVVGHLTACAACASLFQSRAAGFERDHGFLTVPEAVPASWTSRPARRWKVSPARWGAAAAVTAAVLLLLIPLRPGREATNLLHSLPVGSESLDLRSMPGIAEREQLQAGLAAYAAGDLDEAISHLQAAATGGRLDTFRVVFLANALAQRGGFARAKSLLDEVDLEALPDPWRGESLWTLYVANFRLGHAHEATRLLQRLREEPGEVGDRARARATP